MENPSGSVRCLFSNRHFVRTDMHFSFLRSCLFVYFLHGSVCWYGSKKDLLMVKIWLCWVSASCIWKGFQKLVHLMFIYSWMCLHFLKRSAVVETCFNQQRILSLILRPKSFKKGLKKIIIGYTHTNTHTPFTDTHTSRGSIDELICMFVRLGNGESIFSETPAMINQTYTPPQCWRVGTSFFPFFCCLWEDGTSSWSGWTPNFSS